MVCAAQRVVRKFLAVREAQLEVALLQYDTKAELYQTKHTYCARWLEIPNHVKSSVVWSDIKLRRKNFCKELTDEEKENARLEEARTLLQGTLKENIVNFKMLPSEEHVLEVIKETVKQWSVLVTIQKAEIDKAILNAEAKELKARLDKKSKSK